MTAISSPDARDEWRTRLEGFQLLQAPDLPVVEALQKPPHIVASAANPVLVVADDGNVYMIKGFRGNSPPEFGYQLAADVIVGHLAQLLEAPVPTPKVLSLDESTIQGYEELQEFVAKPVHASRFVVGYGNKEGIDTARHRMEKVAYGRLAVLYGWLAASDPQLIRPTNATGPTQSCDHGHFFNGGAPWSFDTFNRLPRAEPLVDFVTNGAESATLARTIRACADVTDEQIAAIIGRVPVSWGIAQDDLVSLGMAVARRRDEIST